MTAYERTGPSRIRPLALALFCALSVAAGNVGQMIFSAVHRTSEFDCQRSPNVIGTASVAFSL
jgi:hypothetical protein